MKNILEEAGNQNILSNMNGIFCDNPHKEQQNIGDQFLENLLGNKAADFTSAVSSDPGVSKVATNRLVSMLGPVVAGFLGNKLVKEKWSMADLMGELNKERSSILSDMPSGLKNSFGLNNIADNKKYDNVKTTDNKKKNNSWITWLIIILLLLLLIFWWRSCRKTERPVIEDRYETRTSQVVDTVRNETSRAADRLGDRDRDTTHLTLSDGQRIVVYKNGEIDKMVRYLNSNDYKNASDNDLKSRWFEFEDINFVFGSANEFRDDESQRAINNIAAILKSYDNAKIRIAGYADKVGSEDANMELSEQRANYIKSLLVKAGVASNRITTEGFGEEKATRSANASDDDRAKDRDIAFRFMK